MWAAGHVDATAEADGMLIDKGASVDEVDDRGRTALMIAAGAGHDSIARARPSRSSPRAQNKSRNQSLGVRFTSRIMLTGA
jgi:ankyrin repeat protein